MPRVITTLQAMSHPTVVETINCLSEMSQRLQDENDALKKPWVGLTGPEKALIASVSLDVHDAVHRTEAKLKEKNT